MRIFGAVMWSFAGVLMGGCTHAPTPNTSAPTSSEPASKPAVAVADPTPAVAVDPAAERDPDPPPTKPNPYIAPPVRTAGGLTVEAPPRKRQDEGFLGRLRSHTEGALSKDSARMWVGPQVPGFVELLEGTAELTLLDRVGDEFLAFYRDPYGASSCGLGEQTNCLFFARLYDLEGHVLWTVALNELMSAPTHLEVQDIRYADGALYFNEACQGYSSGAKGKCSALVALDPTEPTVLWRTRSLVSNGRMLVHGDYIVCGYGFTGERDNVFVVRRSDGKIMQKVGVPKAPEQFIIADDGLLEVTIYFNTVRLYEMRGWDGAKPSLVKTKRRRSPDAVTTGR